MSFNRREWIKNAIRRMSYKFPPRNTAYAQARIARGLYKCAICGGSHKAKEVELDHVHPLIDPSTGFVDWNQFVERMFPPIEGWQVLCIDCHRRKSEAENAQRAHRRAKTNSEDVE
jgi:5-methylcytosine-specific restriction endonuclease McrA